MPLTDTAARQAKPKEKDYKLSDANGLFLLVKASGSKYWRLKYRYLGAEKLLAFGVYPDVKLAEARSKADEARKQLRDGIDPGELRKIKKAFKVEAAANSFQAVGEEWYAKQSPVWSEVHATKTLWMLEKNLFPLARRSSCIGNQSA